MAKKTAAPKKTTPAPSAAPAKKAAPKKAAKAKPAAPPMSDEQIGETAGLVWKVLLDEGPQTTAALKKLVDAPGDTVVAAIGWLAREGKLDFDASGRALKIGLR